MAEIGNKTKDEVGIRNISLHSKWFLTQQGTEADTVASTSASSRDSGDQKPEVCIVMLKF